LRAQKKSPFVAPSPFFLLYTLAESGENIKPEAATLPLLLHFNFETRDKVSFMWMNRSIHNYVYLTILLTRRGWLKPERTRARPQPIIKARLTRRTRQNHVFFVYFCFCFDGH
jgi:hypothetical protein